MSRALRAPCPDLFPGHVGTQSRAIGTPPRRDFAVTQRRSGGSSGSHRLRALAPCVTVTGRRARDRRRSRIASASLPASRQRRDGARRPQLVARRPSSRSASRSCRRAPVAVVPASSPLGCELPCRRRHPARRRARNQWEAYCGARRWQPTAVAYGGAEVSRRSGCSSSSRRSAGSCRGGRRARSRETLSKPVARGRRRRRRSWAPSCARRRSSGTSPASTSSGRCCCMIAVAASDARCRRRASCATRIRPVRDVRRTVPRVDGPRRPAIAVVYTVVVAGLRRTARRRADRRGCSSPARLASRSALEPARRHVRDIVDRLVYGERDDPLALVRERDAADDDRRRRHDLLPALTATLGTAMRLDFVAIDISDDVACATQRRRLAPRSVRPTANLEIVRPRAPATIPSAGSSSAGATDRACAPRPKALDDIVPACRARGQPRRAHSRPAALEPRRRHRARGGAAPPPPRSARRTRPVRSPASARACASVAGSIATPADRSRRRIELLERLTCELDNAGSEVKRIVRDLRPTALDDHGLTARGRRVRAAASTTTVRRRPRPAGEPTSTLPAAVEIATYRITTEALTNVVRHAQREHVARCGWSSAITSTSTSPTTASVSRSASVGHRAAAMHERVTELGGTSQSTVRPRTARASTRACRSTLAVSLIRVRRSRRPSDLPARTCRVAAGHRRRRARRRGRPRRGRSRRSSTNLHPDVVLLDLHLPDGSGLDVNRWFAREHPEIKVIMLTMSEDHHSASPRSATVHAAISSRAPDPTRIEHALRTVMAGEVVLDHDIAGIITGLTQLRHLPAAPVPPTDPREFEILALLAPRPRQHLDRARTHASPKTVRNHVSNVFAKINVTDRAQAIVLAHQHGVGTVDR